MSIRKKILGGFIIVVIIGALLGIAGLISTSMLTGMSAEMHEFQIESAKFSGILNAHYNWRNGLTRTVMDGSPFTGSLDPSACALGTWLRSEDAKNVTDPQILSLLNKVNTPHDFIHQGASPVLAKVDAGDLTGAQYELLNVVYPQLQVVIEGLTAIGTRYNELMEEKVSDMESLGTFISVIIIILIVIGVIIALGLGIIIAGMISKPLILLSSFMKRAGTTGDVTVTPEAAAQIQKLSGGRDEMAQLSNGAAAFIQHVTHIAQELETVANGDLTTEIEILSDADTMGKSLNHMVSSLNTLFSGIQQSTVQVSSGAKQIADGSQSLAQGSAEQSSSVEQLSAEVTQIAQKTKDNAEMAGKAAMLANTIKHNAEKGSRQMDEMTAAVRDINQASQSIGKVIKTIDDIAFQTNILALNAAVEAARAGQHGKGFAVVAEEVRNLASKSADAAKETSAMIENSMEKAELGSRIAEETAASLTEIVQGINESSQIVSEIAQSSDEQSAGIAQINTGIDQVANVVQQNSATAEESAAASEEMSGQSAMLEELVAQFKLKGSGGQRPQAISRPARDDKRIAMPGGEFGKY